MALKKMFSTGTGGFVTAIGSTLPIGGVICAGLGNNVFCRTIFVHRKNFF